MRARCPKDVTLSSVTGGRFTNPKRSNDKISQTLSSVTYRCFYILFISILHFQFFLGRDPLTLRWTHFRHRGLGQVPDAVSITKTAPSRFTREQVQQTSGGGRIRLLAPAKVRCLQI